MVDTPGVPYDLLGRHNLTGVLMLPDSIKRRLRNREDGRDIIGFTVSLRTIRKIIKLLGGWYGNKPKGSQVHNAQGD